MGGNAYAETKEATDAEIFTALSPAEDGGLGELQDKIEAASDDGGNASEFVALVLAAVRKAGFKIVK